MTLAPVDPAPRATEQRVDDLMRPAAESSPPRIADTEFVPPKCGTTPKRSPPASCSAPNSASARWSPSPRSTSSKAARPRKPNSAEPWPSAPATTCGSKKRPTPGSSCCGKRRNATHIFRVQWTMDDAKRAGIAGNPAYAKYPRQMLMARASAELVRQMCPEVLGGITLFAEEAVDIDPTTSPSSAPPCPPRPL